MFLPSILSTTGPHILVLVGIRLNHSDHEIVVKFGKFSIAPPSMESRGTLSGNEDRSRRGRRGVEEDPRNRGLRDETSYDLSLIIILITPPTYNDKIFSTSRVI